MCDAIRIWLLRDRARPLPLTARRPMSFVKVPSNLGALCGPGYASKELFQDPSNVGDPHIKSDGQFSYIQNAEAFVQESRTLGALHLPTELAQLAAAFLRQLVIARIERPHVARHRLEGEDPEADSTTRSWRSSS